jgi:tetratricopeptide (TPR) repeat protein
MPESDVVNEASGTKKNSSNVLSAALNHHAAGRLAIAEQLYHKILSTEPDDAIALNHAGLLQIQKGKAKAGIVLIRKATELKPDYADAFGNLGVGLRRLGLREEAIAAYRRAIELKKNSAALYANLGDVFREAGRMNEAVEACQRAVVLNPNDSSIRNSLGLALHYADHYAAAVEEYRQALVLNPKNPETLCNLGAALKLLNRLDEALDACRQAVALKPNYVQALCNMGAILVDLGKPNDAISIFQRAFMLDPECAEAHSNLGNVLRDAGRIREAIDHYLRAVARKPNFAQAHFNFGMALLQTGNFEQGWAHYEWRWGVKDLARELSPVPRNYPQPKWNGEHLDGKSILVYSEQGLGDTLQFVRYLPLLERYGGNTKLRIPRSLAGILRGLSGKFEISTEEETLPEFDVHCALLSLPHKMRTTLSAVPAQVPYLQSEPERITSWKQRLPTTGFRVGISWQGNPNRPGDDKRSIPLRHFAAIAGVPDIQLICIQKQTGLTQLEELPAGMQLTLFGAELDAGPDAFIDTAAVMANLDLIITSDTAIAHLAGALGRPTWLLLQRVPDWRWMLERDDSPWYPTMRLFRQKEAGNWDEVFNRVAVELTKAVGGDRSALLPSSASLLHAPASDMPVIPISVGELLDKITILELKAARISDPKKLAHVQRELSLLRSAQGSDAHTNPMFRVFVSELTEINSELWDIENGLRKCEQENNFGAHFVNLARTVYQMNDRRAALKRAINLATGSSIIEEKMHSSSEPSQRNLSN